MAHPTPPHHPLTKKNAPVLDFRSINTSYPGLTSIHSDPNVFRVHNFLTPHECRRLIALARPHLQPIVVKNAESGVVEADPDQRTSTNANLRQDEIPSMFPKFVVSYSATRPTWKYFKCFITGNIKNSPFTPMASMDRSLRVALKIPDV
jgi:hypothetical protein